MGLPESIHSLCGNDAQDVPRSPACFLFWEGQVHAAPKIQPAVPTLPPASSHPVRVTAQPSAKRRCRSNSLWSRVGIGHPGCCRLWDCLSLHGVGLAEEAELTEAPRRLPRLHLGGLYLAVNGSKIFGQRHDPKPH